MRTRLLTRSVGFVAVLLSCPGTAVSGQDNMREFAFDRASSVLYIVTHKEGLLSFLGHEHAILPMSWKGGLCLGEPVAAAGSEGQLVIRTDSLVIDSDSARALAGLGEGPGESTVRNLQRKLLDADHLDARGYPEVRVDVVAVGDEGGIWVPGKQSPTEPGTVPEAEAVSPVGSPEASPRQENRVRVRAALTLRGETRESEVPVTLEPLDEGGLRVVGVLTVRQSDFGIQPESIAGVVKVSDPVDLHFLLVAFPTGRACEPEPPHPDDPPGGVTDLALGDGHGSVDSDGDRDDGPDGGWNARVRSDPSSGFGGTGGVPLAQDL